MPKRAVTYARVSGDDRHTEGRNLQGQLALCRRYAGERGYEIVSELAEDDRGASGAAFELPQLDQVRELARAGAFDVLVVRELDRLSRDLLKQLLVEHELKRAGVRIEYVLGEYPDTPEGRLNKHIRATVAEFEREKIKERMVRARYRAVEEGSVLAHGRPPFGYRSVRNGARFELVIEPDEAAVVRLIFELYLHGENGGQPLNSYDIAAVLSGRGVLTAVDRGTVNVPKQRAVGAWAPASVGRILRNETYAGTWHYRKLVSAVGPDGKTRRLARPREEWLAVDVPAIIPPSVWVAAAARREANQDAAARRLKEPRLYLLRGRVTCGLCGVKMHGIAPSAQKPHAYYKCPATAQHSNYARRCTARHFRTEQVDSAVWDWVRDLLEHPQVLAAGLAEVRARQAAVAQPLAVELADVERSLADVRRRGERLLDAYLSGEVEKDAYGRANRPLRERIALLEQRRRDLLLARDDAVLSEADLADIVAFTEGVARELAEVGESLAFQRFVIEKLDVRAVLFEEDGEKKAGVRCALGVGRGTLRLNAVIRIVAMHPPISRERVALWVVDS